MKDIKWAAAALFAGILLCYRCRARALMLKCLDALAGVETVSLYLSSVYVYLNLTLTLTDFQHNADNHSPDGT